MSEKTVNKAILVGNLGADPQVHHPVAGGKSRITFSVATSKKWRDASGAWKESPVQWHRVVVWEDPDYVDGGLFGILRKFLRKGMQVYVEGRLQYYDWEDNDGISRTRSEIVAKTVVITQRREAA